MVTSGRGARNAPHLTAVPTPAATSRFWAEVEDGLDALTGRLVEEIREELPTYHALPAEEQTRTVRELLGAMTESLRKHELPPPERLQMIRASARRRAYYGMPVYDVLAAFHFAHRGLWERFRGAPSGSERLLVDLVEPMAAWAQEMSQAVVDAYVDQQGGRDARERELCAQLFELLDDPGRLDGVSDILRELSYDPDGEFTVLVGRRRAWTRDATAALQRASRRLTGVVRQGTRAGLAIMISQGMAVDDLAHAAHEVIGAEPLGVGLARRGVEGIRESVADAVLALRVAEESGRAIARFDEEWFLAALVDQTTRLAPLLARPKEVAVQNPDLAEAVVAFADAGFSLAGAGERLRLHPNSVSYRLGKWQEHTGLDVRSFSDLARSLAAIARARSAR
ncbi:CdaR family transcriptional regulator [Microbacterium sp. MYb64]|uniref:PucR family transcriptional regulator n=1 Tax=Microbacterium sp. MYb64 TaxID=1848691 RepID=UPI000CFDA53D|nr:helix-turn-helix domain-containing protein [Microbacterium sp. MYb64]